MAFPFPAGGESGRCFDTGALHTVTRDLLVPFPALELKARACTLCPSHIKG
jgi:hypothetical protein